MSTNVIQSLIHESIPYKAVFIGRMISAERQGIMWSATNVVGTPPLSPKTTHTAGSNLLTSNPTLAAGAHQSGYFEASQRTTGTPSALANGSSIRGATSVPSPMTVANSAFGGGNEIDYLSMATVISMNEWRPLTAGVDPPFRITRHAGCASGYYATIPVFEADLGISETNTVVRKITQPINFRLQAVIFYAAASAAGNSARLVIGSTVVASSGAMTSTAPSAILVSAANLGLRNLTKDMVVELQATTAGTAGFTSLGAVLVGHTTGHFNSLPINDLTLVTSGSETINDHSGSGRTNAARTNLSGPATGSLVPYPFTVNACASGQTALAMSQIIVPHDGYVVGVQYSVRGSAAGNTSIVHNVTKDLQIDSASTTTTTTTSRTYESLTNHAVSRNDVIELRATTGGTGITAIGGNLLILCQGHVNTNPQFD